MTLKFLSSPAKVVFLLLLIMLGAQAFTGQQGILMWRQYAIAADDLQRQKQELEIKKIALENQLALLRGNRSNKDYVEEQAMIKLNLISPKDKVIIINN
jgi:cell division protein FtsB